MQARVEVRRIRSYLTAAAVRTPQQMSITLPNEMAEFVRTKVASGDCALDSEALRDARRALRERAVEA
ncbi:hypothetical protein BSFA1_53610 [Burkholderia sp. SFA1]|nr:hypothetical protein BSFA1_53610 [Burkholderia sp. SFA1]